jgi:predicted amidophosphoribosyltransferase
MTRKKTGYLNSKGLPPLCLMCDQPITNATGPSHRRCNACEKKLSSHPPPPIRQCDFIGAERRLLSEHNNDQ